MCAYMLQRAVSIGKRMVTVHYPDSGKRSAITRINYVAELIAEIEGICSDSGKRCGKLDGNEALAFVERLLCYIGESLGQTYRNK